MPITLKPTALTPAPESVEMPPQPRIRLEFLDGLRGLAALYVALFHIFSGQGLVWHDQPLALRLALGWVRYGQFAVDVFIVLSGFCLMLPVARTAAGELRGGLRGFLGRRAWRILPPYYAAVVVSLLLILAARLAHTHVLADNAEVFTPGNLMAHLLVIHNLRHVWSDSINMVLWSVATEWQIYFLFALLLLPVWRRFGSVAAIAVGFGLGYLPHLLIASDKHNLDWARPWYLGLFALGMAGAVLCFSPDPRRTAWLDRLPWGRLGLVLSAAVVAGEIVSKHDLQALWLKDPVVGAATVCLIVSCVKSLRETEKRRPLLILRLLDSRPVVLLGGFSYSLYLMNVPAMWLFKLILHPLHPSPYAELALRLTVAPALALGVAYLFHRAFERPFMTSFEKSPLRRPRRAEQPNEVSQ